MRTHLKPQLLAIHMHNQQIIELNMVFGSIIWMHFPPDHTYSLPHSPRLSSLYCSLYSLIWAHSPTDSFKFLGTCSLFNLFSYIFNLFNLPPPPHLNQDLPVPWGHEAVKGGYFSLLTFDSQSQRQLYSSPLLQNHFFYLKKSQDPIKLIPLYIKQCYFS